MSLSQIIFSHDIQNYDTVNMLELFMIHFLFNLTIFSGQKLVKMHLGAPPPPPPPPPPGHHYYFNNEAKIAVRNHHHVPFAQR